MSDHSALPAEPSAHAPVSPFDTPDYVWLGESAGTVFLRPRHLDVISQLPLPGIVIFVHGVNSDGEWFAAAEEGLCKGLNDRLKRNREHMLYPTPDGGSLRPVQYLPDLTPNGFLNPDKVSDNFIANYDHFSPVIHFRWGYKANADELQEFGDDIYLNENNYWGGGPFANGCTAIPDLWSIGLSDQLFLWLHVQHLNPTPDRMVYPCPARPYYVLAALRLARLVQSIRSKQADVPITIVCHSQGNMIGIAAAFLGDCLPEAIDAAGKRGRCVADTYVLCNPPYSLVKKNPTQGWAERGLKDAEGDGGRQTWEARIATLQAFFDIIRGQADAQQPDESIDDAMKNESHGFTAELDRNKYGYGLQQSTHGRVTLYFNPHDQVISASTVQGIGWRGLDQQEIDATNAAGVFCQRVFAQGFTVGQRVFPQGATIEEKHVYDFWADQHNKPAYGSKDFWYPPSPPARYSLEKGLAANKTIVGKITTVIAAPVMIVLTNIKDIRINADPPKNWKTPLNAPDLPEPFKPGAVRFGQASEKFDQGLDAPGEHRAQGRTRDASDPYAGDRKVPHTATEDAKRKGTDAPEGNSETEAALLYEHRAMLRMEAKREKLYPNGKKVEEEDDPEKASATYTAWRNEKIKKYLEATINAHASDHSTIMTNPEHARKALAYDIAVGVCRIKKEDLARFRRIADWRFLDGIQDNSHAVFFEYFDLGKFKNLSVYDWANKQGSEGAMPKKIKNQREVFG